MNRKIAIVNDLNRNGRMAYLNMIPIIAGFGDRSYIGISDNVKYDAVITGYIKNDFDILDLREKIGDVKLDNPRALALINPAFADNGIKYEGITDSHIYNYKKLLELSDIMTPNLTEACFLANEPYNDYREKYCTIEYNANDKEKCDVINQKIIQSLETLLGKLRMKKNQITIITGIELYNSILTILDVFDGDHNKRQITCNYSGKVEDRFGAGEIFNAMFFEVSTSGFNLVESLSAATSFVNNSLRFSKDNNFDKSDGIVFEPILYDNMKVIKKRYEDIIKAKNKNINKEV